MKVDRSTVITIGCMLLVIMLLFAWILYNNQSQQAERLAESVAGRILVPADTTVGYTTIDGTPVSLEESVGTVVVLYSWASWCPRCADDLLKLSSLASTYDEADVTFIAINRADSLAAAKKFLEREVGSTNDIQLLFDPHDQAYDTMGGQTMPELVLLGVDGSELYRQRSVINTTDVASRLDTVLNDM